MEYKFGGDICWQFTFISSQSSRKCPSNSFGLYLFAMALLKIRTAKRICVTSNNIFARKTKK
ncbi:Uncharacterized protein APZ42_004476 [Daphnia magna]|uniref:Uncharacterized protein n=1 Tax=Daphnia magna TaxID=35525 RepID=A0A162F0E1_9CRUS|nr:Uncharacterized protein APZ42_004476 [Daphnia magna]